jgi:hypothetical protein
MSLKSVQAAREAIKTAIDRANGPLPPPFLTRFLLDHWLRNLAITHRDQGESSMAWAEVVKTTDLLLWSVTPKTTKEDKRALTKQLEPLLSSLRAGMAGAGADHQAQEAFLSQLKDWHLKLIIQPADKANPAKITANNPDSTLQLDMNDPHYKELLELLINARLEKIEL